jgi:hypothetical protein
MVAGIQPGLQARLVARQVDVRDPDFGKAQLRAPRLDGACELVEVGLGIRHGKNGKQGRGMARNTTF